MLRHVITAAVHAHVVQHGRVGGHGVHAGRWHAHGHPMWPNVHGVQVARAREGGGVGVGAKSRYVLQVLWVIAQRHAVEMAPPVVPGFDHRGVLKGLGCRRHALAPHRHCRWLQPPEHLVELVGCCLALLCPALVCLNICFGQSLDECLDNPIEC